MKRISLIFIFGTLSIMIVSLIAYTQNDRYTISSYAANLSQLSREQKINICMGAKSLNNTVLWPDEAFSFNKTVGPRTVQQGYRRAPAYFENQNIPVEGGGICLLSSVLYNAALRANMEIIERTPHVKPIKSVPVGLDATVWYGKNDLKFRNITHDKNLILAKCSDSTLTVAFKRNIHTEPAKINVKRAKISPHKLNVKVFRHHKVEKTLVSDDIYKI